MLDLVNLLAANGLFPAMRLSLIYSFFPSSCIASLQPEIILAEANDSGS